MMQIMRGGLRSDENKEQGTEALERRKIGNLCAETAKSNGRTVGDDDFWFGGVW